MGGVAPAPCSLRHITGLRHTEHSLTSCWVRSSATHAEKPTPRPVRLSRLSSCNSLRPLWKRRSAILKTGPHAGAKAPAHRSLQLTEQTASLPSRCCTPFIPTPGAPYRETLPPRACRVLGDRTCLSVEQPQRYRHLRPDGSLRPGGCPVS